jgi:hypothetical protein
MVRCDSLLTRRLDSPGFASLCHQRVRPVHLSVRSSDSTRRRFRCRLRTFSMRRIASTRKRNCQVLWRTLGRPDTRCGPLRWSLVTRRSGMGPFRRNGCAERIAGLETQLDAAESRRAHAGCGRDLALGRDNVGGDIGAADGRLLLDLYPRRSSGSRRCHTGLALAGAAGPAGSRQAAAPGLRDEPAR